MMEIVTIWLKIIGIIIAWELWKYIGWNIVCWLVEKQVEKYENNKSKCPYLNESNNKRYKD